MSALRRQGAVIVSTLAIVLTTACTASRTGELSVEEAFPDKRVLRMVEAAIDGNSGEVDRQIAAGADVNYVGHDGVSPLLWVMGAAHSYNGMEILLKRGANPNYRDEKRGASAMAFAAGGNRPDFLELLSKYKGNPNLSAPSNKSLLQIAAGQFRDDNVEILLRSGADINMKTDWGTVGTTAAARGNFKMVAMLLERGLTNDMQGLARTFEIVQVPPSSEAQRWKDKVIVMLKERGATFPAFVPCYPPGDPRRVAANCRNSP